MMRSPAASLHLLLAVAVFSSSMFVWQVSADQEAKKLRKEMRDKSKHPKIRRTIRVRQEEPSELSSSSTTTQEPVQPSEPGTYNKVANLGSTNNIEVKPEISIQMPQPHPQPVPQQPIVVSQEQSFKQQEEQRTTSQPPAKVSEDNQLPTQAQNSGPGPGSEHVELNGVGNSRVLKISNSGNHEHVEISGSGNTRHLSEREPPHQRRLQESGDKEAEEEPRPVVLQRLASAVPRDEQQEVPTLRQEPQFGQSQLERIITPVPANHQHQQQPHQPTMGPPANYMLLSQSPQGGYTIAQPLIMSPAIYGVLQAPYLAAGGPPAPPTMWDPVTGFPLQTAPQMLQPMPGAMTPAQVMYHSAEPANTKLPAGHPACVTNWMTRPPRKGSASARLGEPDESRKRPRLS